MKPTWADILPKSSAAEFKLAGGDAIDVDDEVATTDWPLPPAKPWDPKPEPSLLQRIAEVFR